MSSHSHLLPNGFKAQIAQWLQEDTPSFDYGGYVVGETDQEAILYCKAEGVLAGVPFFDEVFKQLDCKYVNFTKCGYDELYLIALY
jgi:nicotinate-nucleotide pyrophosphorylase (carboxylating)